MYRKGLIAVALLLLCAWRAAAFDFSVPLSSGQTLYFSYVDGGVAVVHPNTSTAPAMAWNGFAMPAGPLNIPATVTNNGVSYSVIAVYDNAFYGCAGITSVTVAEGVAVLRGGAFRGCSAMTSVSLPSTIDTIGNLAFYNCTALQNFTILRPVPPVCAANAFYELVLGNATLTVPYGSMTAYASVAPWNTFGTIVEAAYDVTLTAVPNYEQRGSVEGGGVYVIGSDVVLTATPANGYFFACWQDGDTLNPRSVIVTPGAHYVAYFFACRHDTVYVGGDTVEVPPVMHTLTVTSSDPWRGLVAGNATVPHGTLIEIAAIPLGDNAFTSWSDNNNENPRRVVVDNDITLTASFAPHNGIEGPDLSPWTATVDGRRLTVSCGAGETIRLFDAQGRCMLTHTATGADLRVDLPVAGVYLVSVGTSPAKRIVIE